MPWEALLLLRRIVQLVQVLPDMLMWGGSSTAQARLVERVPRDVLPQCPAGLSHVNGLWGGL